jgi:hypothetical protein
MVYGAFVFCPLPHSELFGEPIDACKNPKNFSSRKGEHHVLTKRLISRFFYRNEVKTNFVRSLFAFMLCLCGAWSAQAQNPPMTAEIAPLPVISEPDVRCVGFIQNPASVSDLQVIGGEEEQERRSFWQGDYVYISGGAQQGISVGQQFSVVRPRGNFKSKWSAKRGSLGTYYQEVARVRVVSVKGNVSVAQVVGSCETILRGDFLRAVPQRTAPVMKDTATLDRFADGSGKAQGRIVMARDLREMPAASEVVYIDLGAEDNVKVGDNLTIYRPAGTGNITRFRDDEVSPAGSGGFESDTFHGGKFSNQAMRVKNVTSGIHGETVSTSYVNRRRPTPPRKIVGEMTIIDVQQRTATAIITRSVQEVKTGDYVEVQ